jgi:anti-sigma B factor antagonist
MPTEFTLTETLREGNVAALAVAGRLDAAAAGGLRRHCTALREAGHRHLALDLSGVSFVASSGVGALLALTEEFGAEGGLYLAPPSPAVLSVIRLLNLQQFLAIYDSQEEALSIIR